LTINRLFLAIPVTLYSYEQIKKEFNELLQGEWREEDHLHVTIAFLGQRFQPDMMIEKLSQFDWSFELSKLTKFDYFSKSRVFVATTHNPGLQRLYGRLEMLLGLEYADLNPHATLMRVKKIVDAEAFSNLLKTAPIEPIGILKSKVILYSSVLQNDGAIYEPLQEWLI